VRRGYPPFTHRTFVSRRSGGSQTSTIRMLASFQATAPRRPSHWGRTGEPMPVQGLLPMPGGLGPRSECASVRPSDALPGRSLVFRHATFYRSFPRNQGIPLSGPARRHDDLSRRIDLARYTSYSSRLPATARFSESATPSIGMRTRSEQSSRWGGVSPWRSSPRTRIVGRG
jgi:hypothetical protein